MRLILISERWPELRHRALARMGCALCLGFLLAVPIVLLAGPAIAMEAPSELRVLTLDGVAGRFENRTRHRFVTGVTPDGPITSAIEHGCMLEVLPAVLSSGRIAVQLDLECARLDEPVPTVSVDTPDGPQRIQQPNVVSFTVDTLFEADDGETVVLDQLPGAPTLHVTPQLLEALGSRHVSVAVSLPADAVGPGENVPPRFENVTLLGTSGFSASTRHQTRRHFLIGLDAGDPTVEGVDTGCQLEATPTVLVSGLVAVALDVTCRTLDRLGRSFVASTPHGTQRLQQPVTHRQRLQTSVVVQDGQSLVVAGALLSRQETIVVLTVNRVQSAMALLDVRLARAGSGKRPVRDGTTFAEDLTLVTGQGRESRVLDRTSQRLVTGFADGAAVMTTVDPGCDLTVTSTMASASTVMAATRIGCTAVDTRVPTLTVRTPRGAQRLQLPTVHHFDVDTTVQMDDGTTRLLAGARRDDLDAVIALTSRFVSGSDPAAILFETRTISEVARRSRSTLGTLRAKYFEELSTTAVSGHPASVRDRAVQHLLTGASAGEPASEGIDTGCSSMTVATILPTGSVALDVDAVCDVLDDALPSFTIQTDHGDQRIRLPVVHTRRVTTGVTVRDGETIVLGGLATADEEALFLVTPRVVPGPPVDQVSVETSLAGVAARIRLNGLGGPEGRDLQKLHLVSQSGESVALAVGGETLLARMVVAGELAAEPIETGCASTVRPMVTGGAVELDVALSCRAVDVASSRMRVTLAAGTAHLELPTVHTFEVETKVVVSDGATLVLGRLAASDEEAIVLATPREIDTVPVSQMPQVALQLSALRQGATDDVVAATASGLATELVVNAFDGQLASQDGRTLVDVEIPLARGRVARTTTSTGYALDVLPLLLPNGNVLVDLSLTGRALDIVPAPVERRRLDPRPEIDAVAVATIFEVPPGETVAVAASLDSQPVVVHTTAEVGAGSPVPITLTIVVVPDSSTGP